LVPEARVDARRKVELNAHSPFVGVDSQDRPHEITSADLETGGAPTTIARPRYATNEGWKKVLQRCSGTRRRGRGLRGRVGRQRRGDGRCPPMGGLERRAAAVERIQRVVGGIGVRHRKTHGRCPGIGASAGGLGVG
jgi:hypothetical protein